MREQRADKTVKRDKDGEKWKKKVDKGRKRCYISKAVCGTPRVKEKTSKKEVKKA